jgi:uncharacterized membrane protein YvbJ
MKNCQICGTKITRHNAGFSNLLDNEEQKRLLKLKKEQTICTDCKFIVMAVEIISPFGRKYE